MSHCCNLPGKVSFIPHPPNNLRWEVHELNLKSISESLLLLTCVSSVSVLLNFHLLPIIAFHYMFIDSCSHHLLSPALVSILPVSSFLHHPALEGRGRCRLGRNVVDSFPDLVTKSFLTSHPGFTVCLSAITPHIT